MGPRCLYTTDCPCSVGLLGALTHSPPKSPPHLLTHLASPHLLWGPPPSSCTTLGPLTPPEACPETGQGPAALALPWSILCGQPWMRHLGNAEPTTSTLRADGGGPWPGRGSDLTKFARLRPRLTPHLDLDPSLHVWFIVFSSGSERGHCCHRHCLIKDDHHILVRLLHRSCISKVPSLLSTHLCV